MNYKRLAIKFKSQNVYVNQSKNSFCIYDNKYMYNIDCIYIIYYIVYTIIMVYKKVKKG